MLRSVLVQVIIQPMARVRVEAVVTPLPASRTHSSSLSLSSMDGSDKAFKLSLPTWSSPVVHSSYSLAASSSEYLVARSRPHKAKCLDAIVLGQSLEEVLQRVFHGIGDGPTWRRGALPVLLMSLITLVSPGRGGDANLQEYSQNMDLMKSPFEIPLYNTPLKPKVMSLMRSLSTLQTNTASMTPTLLRCPSDFPCW